MSFLEKIILFLLSACFLTIQSFSQTYRDELGKRITREEFEQKITEGPYFGVPAENPQEKKLVYRMPFGMVDAGVFYEKLGLEDARKEGKSLIVVFYPGKDECNSTGLGNNPATFQKNHQDVVKYAEKHQAVSPVYVYKNPHGLEKYQGIMEWIPDPEGVFEKQFFQFHYPCKSFVVITSTGQYRAILGEFPISQIDVALKKLKSGK